MRSRNFRRIVLITGATRGCGRAMALRFAFLGHTVIACGRSKALVESLALELGPPHEISVLDVTDDGAVRLWAERLAGKDLVPDLVLNNAAIITPERPLWEARPEEITRILEVNVAGTLNVIRRFVPLMLTNGRGIVVNFSSGWGRAADPGVGPYITTKWAVEGLSRALAEDLPEGFASVALNPGLIDTEMLRSAFGEEAGKYPRPEDWAERTVPFLLKLNSRDNGKALTAPGY